MTFILAYKGMCQFLNRNQSFVLHPWLYQRVHRPSAVIGLTVEEYSNLCDKEVWVALLLYVVLEVPDLFGYRSATVGCHYEI